MAFKQTDPTRPNRNRSALSAVLLTLFLDLVGFSLIFPLFPSILQYYLSLEGSDGVLGWILNLAEQIGTLSGLSESFTPVLFGGIVGSLFSMLQFLMAPLWGAISDRIGRRKVLLLTVFGTAVSYLIWIVAGKFWLLLLARALGGAMSGNISVCSAAAADLSDRQNRAKAMGMVGATIGFGFVVGPAIGALFVLWNPSELLPTAESSLGLHPFSSAAIGAFLLSVVNWIWVFKAFPETLDPSVRAKAEKLSSYNPFLTLFRVTETGVRRAGLLNYFYLLSFSGMEFTLSFLGVSRFGFGIPGITLMMVYVGFVLILVQGGLIRRLVPKYGEKRMVTIGMFFIMIGFVWLAVASSMFDLYGALALMGIGAGVVSPCLSALLSLYAKEETQGQSMGSFRAWGALARAFGPLTAGFLFWWAGSTVAYVAGAMILVIPFIMGLSLPRPTK